MLITKVCFVYPVFAIDADPGSHFTLGAYIQEASEDVFNF